MMLMITIIIMTIRSFCPLQFLLPLAPTEAMADLKYQGPKTGTHVDQGKFLKLAQRVEETLSKTLYPDPKQLDPNHVLVSPLNRMGGSPNVQHIHFGILKSFQVNSFDRTCC